MTIDSAGVNEIAEQSTLAARREARRRKILENAENRLRKLTGVEQKSHVLIDDFRPIEYDETSRDNHNIDHTRVVNEMLSNQLLNSINQTSSSLPIENEVSVNRLGNWKYNKLSTLIVISLLANFFTIISTIIYDDTESTLGCNMIFLPFLGLKCLEYYLQNNRVPENNIFQLFFMANLRNDLLKRMFVYTQFLTNFIQDLCIYFFCFVFINQLFKVSIIFR